MPQNNLFLTTVYSQLWLLPWLSCSSTQRLTVWMYTLPLSIAPAHIFSISSGFPKKSRGEELQTQLSQGGFNLLWCVWAEPSFKSTCCLNSYRLCTYMYFFALFPPPVLPAVEPQLLVEVSSCLVLVLPALSCFVSLQLPWLLLASGTSWVRPANGNHKQECLECTWQ